MEHPNELLEKPKGIWLCNLLEQAAYITDSNTERFFEPCLPGVYVRGSFTPIIKPDTVCYKKSIEDKNKITDLKNIIESEDDIIDSEGNIIISRFDINRRRHLFILNPELPISAINIAYNIIIDYLFRYCKHARGVKRNHLYQFINNEYREEFDLNDIEDLLSDTLDSLYKFIYNDDWSIYFHRLQGTTLLIEKHVDFRIYEYTRIMYENKQKELGEAW